MNNDRFKYRVWDKENRKWLNLEYLSLCSEGYLVGPDDQGGFIFDDVDYEIVFSTGLKDKNGKLIYENFLLKIHRVSEFTAIVQVFWDSEETCFAGKILKFEKLPGGDEDWDKQVGDIMSIFSVKYDDVEIIGDIYENPELLPNN